MTYTVLVVLPGDKLPESYSFATRADADAFADRARAKDLAPWVVGPGVLQ